jgi:hypothetical protein
MSKSKFMLGTILTVAFAFSQAAVGAPKAAKDRAASADKAEAAAPLDKEAQQKLKEHMKMRNHVKAMKYPATKEELVTAFKGFKDVKADDRKWFEETLPSKTFSSAEDVMKALGWEVSADESTTATTTTTTTTTSEKRGK